MDQTIDIKNLRRCAEISRQSRAEGNTPFGALLADKDGNILLEQPNVEITENNAPAMRRLRWRSGHPSCTPKII